MKRVILISCVSKKVQYPTKAENLYQSTLFKFALQYAKMQNADRIYILSALYGLLELSDVVAPYEKTLNSMKEFEIKQWSEKVVDQIIQKGLDLKTDQFIFLAGNNYRKYIIPNIQKISIPMKGLRIGEQLAYLKKEISE